MAIGARSQSARTYLEKHLNEFPTCNLDELVKHALRALRDTLPNEIELSIKVIYLIRVPFPPIKIKSSPFQLRTARWVLLALTLNLRFLMTIELNRI